MSDYTEADYRRDLGIAPDPTSTDSSIVHESIRNAPVGERAQAALAITLGAVDVTEAQRAEAERIVGESDAHPWRAEWHRREVYSRRGEEAELASLYVSRLGESQATAEEHVRRELSAAWTRHRYPVQQLDAVAETLASERKRLAPRPALTTEARTTTAPKVYRGQVGEYVAVSEQRR
ncbi:MAG: hypothetical protein ACTMH5_07660 [Brachybacterium sp.]|uniref:hypothetical protein n=1 Tax=Brachybacterium sp. TaxID=1891286 RepID=UPI003F91FED2